MIVITEDKGFLLYLVCYSIAMCRSTSRNVVSLGNVRVASSSMQCETFHAKHLPQGGNKTSAKLQQAKVQVTTVKKCGEEIVCLSNILAFPDLQDDRPKVMGLAPSPIKKTLPTVPPRMLRSQKNCPALPKIQRGLEVPTFHFDPDEIRDQNMARYSLRGSGIFIAGYTEEMTA
jgi:hypothetical protein